MRHGHPSLNEKIELLEIFGEVGTIITVVCYELSVQGVPPPSRSRRDKTEWPDILWMSYAAASASMKSVAASRSASRSKEAHRHQGGSRRRQNASSRCGDTFLKQSQADALALGKEIDEHLERKNLRHGQTDRYATEVSSKHWASLSRYLKLYQQRVDSQAEELAAKHPGFFDLNVYPTEPERSLSLLRWAKKQLSAGSSGPGRTPLPKMEINATDTDWQQRVSMRISRALKSKRPMT